MLDLLKHHLTSPDDSISQIDFQRLASSGETRYVERKSLLKLQDENEVRKTLSKAVSAFANYDGGVILLGVTNDGTIESGAKDRVGTGTRSEWLQDVITGNISPQFQDFSIKKLKLREDDLSSHVYAIFVGRGNTAYQASDHVYYARMDGKSKPIDGQMVLDIMNRKRNAEVKLLLSFRTTRFFSNSELSIKVYLEVVNDIPLEDARLTIRTFGGNNFTPPLINGKTSRRDEIEDSYSYSYNSSLTYPGERLLLAEGSIRILKATMNRPFIQFTIYARNALSCQYAFVIDGEKGYWVRLFEHPLPVGEDIGKRELWMFSKEWLEEPDYIWDSSKPDRRSEIQKGKR